MHDVLEFLVDLSNNNNREWFNDHRERFESTRKTYVNLSKSVEDELMKFDVLDINRTRTYRIYRDVRFSKDRTPYHKHFSTSYVRAGADRRGGYYLKITPGGSLMAAGFWGPDSSDLLHIRKQISSDARALREVVGRPEFRAYFGNIQGERVKTSPKGFSIDDPEIELLRYRQFILSRPFTDRQVESADFPQQVAEGFRRALPFLTIMTDYLTTDLNGESLINS